jgi:hypothetical protein
MITLGSKVRDKITNITGIVISRHEYMYGCVRWGVQPQEIKDGKAVEASVFDEPQLELVQEQSAVPPPTTGGPRDEPKRPAVPAR